MVLSTTKRPNRFSKPLPEGNGDTVILPNSWEQIKPVPEAQNDPRFLQILEQCGFTELKPVVPLKSRYTRGRPWTRQEFEACFNAWQAVSSITFIAAALNRNPQDIIYRLLDYCHQHGIEFTQRGRSEGSDNWTHEVAECASRLFAAGLPAWKIATLFRVDFEHVEKQLFLGRKDYGHNKKNPFSINTNHKHLVNEQVLLASCLKEFEALDAFAGEGTTTQIISNVFPEARIVAVESDRKTFAVAQKKPWRKSITWELANNLDVLQRLVESADRFDLIDLDPFVTCHQQLRMVWPLLKSSALLFITFGGEYRRSFIISNRKAIALRYGFDDTTLGNKEYLEIVPYFFLGWVAHLAAHNRFTFSVLRAVRYANNCRFWLAVSSTQSQTASQWFQDHVSEKSGGYLFQGLNLPRFAQVRSELQTPLTQTRSL